MQDTIFVFAQNVYTPCDYENEKKEGELSLLEKENSLMLIVLVVVVISTIEASLMILSRICRLVCVAFLLLGYLSFGSTFKRF